MLFAAPRPNSGPRSTSISSSTGSRRSSGQYLSHQQHWRPGTLRVAENFLKEGLHPTPITRDLDWGVPIPLDGYDAKRFYVWFDAVTGYLSASKEWAIRAGRPDAWQAYWDAREPVRQYATSSARTTSSTTRSSGRACSSGPAVSSFRTHVPANEWLLAGGKKVSKSGTVEADAFIPALLANYPPDVIRFYAAVMAPQNHDTELDWDEFRKFREEVLANQYGNLVQRTLVLTRDRYAGKVPAPPDGWSAEGANGVAERLKGAHAKITEEYEKVHLKEALDLALEEVRESNRRFHEARPWQASESDRARILYETLWRLKALATWLAPVLPFSSTEVFRMLGYDGPPGPGEWDVALSPVPAGQSLGEVRPLFPRPETERTSSPASPPASEEGWPPLAACSGIIRSAAPHPSADKLYVLEVDIDAPSPRTVVAGIREDHTPEALTGRPVVLLTNLAPRTIRRITSQGMVLCAETEERAILLAPPDGTPPGTYLEHRSPSDRQISFEEFVATSLTIGCVTGPGRDRPGSSGRRRSGGRALRCVAHRVVGRRAKGSRNLRSRGAARVRTRSRSSTVRAGARGSQGPLMGRRRLDLHVHSQHSPIRCSPSRRSHPGSLPWGWTDSP